MLVGTAAAAFAAQTTEPYHIGVWYFTLWGSQGNTSMQGLNAQAIYGGQPDSWGGVREYNKGTGLIPPSSPGFGAPANYASREPLQGFYDLSSQSDVDKQILEAASEGIDFFAFYWYFDGVTGAENPISTVVSKFMTSAVSNKMGFMLAPIMVGNTTAISLTAWQNVVVPKLVDYMSNASYYKINGRPVIADFQWTFANPADASSAYQILRTATQQRLGVSPYIIDVLGGGNTFNDTYYVAQNLAPDAFSCFQAPMTGAPETYQSYIAGYLHWMATQYTFQDGTIDQNINYIPCGSIGQDARPWWDVGWGSGVYPTISSRPYTTNVSVQLWSQHLQQIKSMIDAGSTHSLQTAILYAWNEWGESAMQIEPSALDGYQYADAVRRVFNLVPRSPRPLR